ncbi:MAG: hypothetical protein C4582_06355 [Desulfobacteraceae bacterium]|jgi:hypothetical protein|nr:MAG: hypothetical protein C4582_06355 [Desulfobacteraceae bacterium]
MNNSWKIGFNRWLVFGLIATPILNPLPSLGQRQYREEMVLPSHYPEGFDGVGRVERVEGEEIVINDCMFRLSPRFTLATRVSHHAPKELLKVGDLVGFKKNSSREIVSIWILESGSGLR